MVGEVIWGFLFSFNFLFIFGCLFYWGRKGVGLGSLIWIATLYLVRLGFLFFIIIILGCL